VVVRDESGVPRVPKPQYKVRTANAIKDDHLKLKSYRNAFERIITTAEPPATVGLYGAWGSGKTSFMQRVREDLDPPEDTSVDTTEPGEARSSVRYPTVWFNLWEHEHNPAPIVAMLNVAREEIKSRLEKEIQDADMPGGSSEFLGKTRRRLRLLNEHAQLADIARSVAWGVATLPEVKGVVNPAAGAIEHFRQQQREQFRLLDEQTRLRQQLKGVVDQLVDAAWREGQDPDEKRLIIFIDDLDRCPPSEIVVLLEQIRLYLSLANCVFVMGVDADVVARAVIAERPELVGLRSANVQDVARVPGPDELATARHEAQRYLEKMIQYPFTLPRLGDTKIKEFAQRVLGEVGFVEDESVQVNDIVGPVLNERRESLSLRFVVRLANALVVNHMVTMAELGSGDVSAREAGGYDLRVTALATVVQHVYPDEYATAMSRSDGPEYLWRQLTADPAITGGLPAEPQLFGANAVKVRENARTLTADRSLLLDAWRFSRYLQLMDAVGMGSDAQEVTETPRVGASSTADDEPAVALQGYNEWYYQTMPRKLVRDHTRHAEDGSILSDAGTIAFLADKGGRGDVVTIGDIPWRVLDIDKGKDRVGCSALLLSEYLLGRWSWHDKENELLWSSETQPWLRRELNERFLPSLPEDMQSRVEEARWPASSNERHGTSLEAVIERVSLLSIEEVATYLTAAKERNAVDPWGNGGWWWLRSPGREAARTAAVSPPGTVVAEGLANDIGMNVGVRPALWLNLDP